MRTKEAGIDMITPDGSQLDDSPDDSDSDDSPDDSDAGFSLSHAMLGLRSIMVSSRKTANDINIHLFVLFAGQ